MNYTVKGIKRAKFSLCENDSVKSVLQSINLLLTTPKGSVPMYREFGLEQNFIDKPINVAKTMMSVQIQEALKIFEPRAKFVGISFVEDNNFPGRIIPILEVEI